MPDPQKSSGGVKSFLRVAFPFISAAAAAGGPLGIMAANAVGKAIGADKAPDGTLDGISGAIASAGMTPDQRIALQKAEQDFQLELAAMNFKSVADLEQIAAGDRDSARKREIAVRDKTPEVGFYLLTALFAAIIFVMIFYSPPTDNEKLLYLLLGAIGSGWTASVQYFYGSSSDSHKKTEMMAAAQPPPQ